MTHQSKTGAELGTPNFSPRFASISKECYVWNKKWEVIILFV